MRLEINGLGAILLAAAMMFDLIVNIIYAVVWIIGRIR